MRKSFTRLSGMLVLLLLSVQLVFAVGGPTVDKLSPTDPGVVTSTTPTFTMTFKSDVIGGKSGAIALYTDGLGSPLKVLQVTSATGGDGITVDGKTVTFSFDGVTLKKGSSYDVLIEGKAILDKATSVAYAGLTWDISVADDQPLTLVTKDGGLSPVDGAKSVGKTAGLGLDFTMEFTEPIAWVAGYKQELEDFALYYAEDAYAGQIGGDLASLKMPTVTINGSKLTINWADDLDAATKYYVRVKKDIIVAVSDKDPFAGILTNTAWNFETNVPETVTPVVTTTQGADNIKINTDTEFFVDFTEKVYVSNGVGLTLANMPTDLMTVMVNGEKVVGTWSVVTANQKFKFKPKTVLSGAGPYIVSVKATTADYGVRDADGNFVKGIAKTIQAGDWIDPVITSMVTANSGGTGFDIFIKASEVGLVHYIVVKPEAEVPTLENIVGMDKDGNLVDTKTLKQYRDGAVGVGSSYGSRSKTTVAYSTNEIYAEGWITIDAKDTEILERVAGLPKTHGQEYKVYAVAIDKSTSTLYTPDFSGIADTRFTGNISAIKVADGATSDVLAPTVWMDADSVGKKDLLNDAKKDGATAGTLAELDRKGQIYLNFIEPIALSNTGGSSQEISNGDIADFITLTDGGKAVGYEGVISDDKKVITLTADSSFKSGSTVWVSIKTAKIQDAAGNVLQPANAGMLTQDFTVETYAPVFVHFTPKDGKTGVDLEKAGSSIKVKFNKAIYVPADDEAVQGNMVELSNDVDSKYYVGTYFDIRKGDATDADRTDVAVKDEFTYVINDASTEVTITRKDGTSWESEIWYYILVESQILDVDRYSIADGDALSHVGFAKPFDEVTTLANNNMSISFKYTDIRKPLITFYEEKTTAKPVVAPVVDINGRTDIDKDTRIGVYIDESVDLGFADKLDLTTYTAGGTNLSLLNNAMRRYFKLYLGDEEISFDVREVKSNGHVTMELDPYYITDKGVKEDPNFETGKTYTVKYISTEIENTDSPAFADANGNAVLPTEATFTIKSTPDVPTVDVVYSPKGGEVLSATTTVEFDFSQMLKFNSTIPSIDLLDGTGALLETITNANAVVSNANKSLDYTFATNLMATTKYGVKVVKDAFVFDNGATWPAKDSTWYFTTKDETNPTITEYYPADGSTVDVLTDSLAIVFSEDVKRVAGKIMWLWESGASEIFQIDAGSIADAQHINSVSGPDTIVFRLPESLELTPNTDYHVIIAPEFVTDASPSLNAFAGISDVTTWNFSTGGHPAPTYAAFSPKDNSLEVVSSFTIKFSEDVVPQDNKFIRLYNIKDINTQVQTWEVDEDGTFNATNNTYTFTVPVASNNDIVLGETYTFEVEDGAFKDADGNDIYAVVKQGVKVPTVTTDPAAWVIEFGDIDAPKVTFWPADGKTMETNIPYNAYLYFKFDEPVALSDNTGTLVSDQSLLSDNMDKFVTLFSTKTGATVAKTVEFVNQDKTIIRVIPNDKDGHNYDGNLYNPTMQTEDTYTLNVLSTDGTYRLSDIKGNLFTGDAVSFETEDITDPVLSAVAVNASDANSTTIEFMLNEAGKAYVYVMAGKPKTAPNAATIMAEAQWSGAVKANTLTKTKDIVLGETVGAATYTAYVYAMDDEVDRYKNPDGSIWVIAEAKESEDRIRDILEAPNAAAVQSVVVTTCDDDLPTVTAKDLHMVENVALAKNIHITFSEDILYNGGADGTITLRKVKNNAEVAAAVSVVNGDSIVINPTALLEAETDYYVEMDRYAVSDDAGCKGPNASLIEWIGKENYYFSTIDETAPVVDSVLIDEQTVVDLNCIDPSIEKFTVFITEKKDIEKVAGKDDVNQIRIYRGTDNTGVLLEVIPVASDLVATTTVDMNDKTYKVLTVDVSDVVFLNQESYYVELDAKSVKDVYGNLMLGDNFTFSTWDNAGPVASWEIMSLNYHFNNSKDGAGLGNIVSNWVKAKSGAAGATASGISSHSVLKIDFNEEVFVNTSTTSKANWVSLKNYGGAIKTGEKSTDQVLSAKELLANVQIGDLAYNIDTTKTDLLVIDVDKANGTSFVIGFKVSESKLYKNAVLDVPNSYSNIDYAYGAADEFIGSLALEAVDYPVTISNAKFGDDPQCGTERNTAATAEVVVIKTNDDTTPELDVPATDPLACVVASDEIVMTFNKRIVKSSYDIAWLEVESASADNLPLTGDDLKDNHYFTINDGVKDLTINTASVVDGDDFTEIKFTTKEKLVQGTTYTVTFKEWVVKDYIMNSPAGTIFEGFTSTFVVTDSEAPNVTAQFPVHNPALDAPVASNTKKFTINFDEKIVKGQGSVQVRRLNGQIWAELDAQSDAVTIGPKNVNNVLTLDFSKLENIKDMDDFTQFYVYMEEGFVYDSVRTGCDANPFEGFDARLGKDGAVLSADWTFTTTDATPPMLVSMYPTQSDAPISLDANLEIVFDENIFTDQTAANVGAGAWIKDAGIVIYYNADVDTENDFGNAVEFIPWSEMFNNPATPDVDRKIRITGTDIDNGFTSNKLIIDPGQSFEKEGNYYVRVNGLAIEDESGNSWSSLNATHTSEWVAKNDIDIDENGDAEWMFTVVNKAKPILDMTATLPVYDGVNAAGDYNYFGNANPTKGIVVGDLTMSFINEDTKQPIDVALTTDEDLTVKIYEYYYNPETLDTEEKLRQEYDINSGNVSVVDNQLILANVELDDDIQGDSLYYVTVDKGFVTTTPEDGAIYWAGIDNGFVWRFQTAADDTFLVGGPSIITPENGITDLTREEADTLKIAFGENIVVGNGNVVIYNADAEPDTAFVTVPSTLFQVMDSTLIVPVGTLNDETNYYVVIEAGAIGDASTVSTPIPAMGDETWWTFATGDNSEPIATVTPAADSECLENDITLTFTYEDESKVTAAGVVTVLDADGNAIDGVVVADPVDTIANVVTVDVSGIPDNTTVFVSAPAGFVQDNAGNLSVAVTDVKLMVGDNKAPEAILLAPVVDVDVDTAAVEVKFNEKVVAVATAVASVNGVDFEMTTTDSLVYTFVATGLVSDMVNEVVIAAGTFQDLGCNALANEAISLPFTVKDLEPATATFIPNAPNKLDDYEGVVLGILFGEAMTTAEGNVIVYNEAGDAVATIAAADFTSANDSLFLAPAVDLSFDVFTVKVDSGAFVDATAADAAKAFVQTTDWVVTIADEIFEDDDCYTIISPKDGETIDTDTVTLVIEFCTEKLVLGDGYVYLADQSASGVDIKVPADSCSVDGSTLTIPVSKKLNENTTYTVTIEPGFVTDLAGNKFNGLVDGDLWNFTVADLTDPTVSLVAASFDTADEDGVASITSNELGMVYLVEENVALDVAAITAAIADMKAIAGTVIAANVAVEVPTVGLAIGNYVAVAVDQAGRMSAASADVVAITETLPPPVVTIAEIQGTGDVSPLVDQEVTTMGVVTTVDKNGYYMQDANEAWSGVYVFDRTNAATIKAGAGVKVTGTVGEYNGATQVAASSIEAALLDLEVEPIEVDAISEMYEAVRVMIKGDAEATLTVNATDAYTLGGVDVSLYLYKPTSYQFKQDYTYHITGIVYESNGNYKVEPYFAEDILNYSLSIGVADLASSIKVYPNPFNEYVALEVPSEIEVSRAVITNIAGQIVKEVINPENSIQTSELKSGVYFISLHTEEGIAKTQRITKR